MGNVTISAVYVNDIIIRGTDKEGRIMIENTIMSEFDMKNLGQLKYFRSTKVTHSLYQILFSQ